VEVLAAIVNAPGAEPRLGFIILPRHAPGTTLLRVLAAPLNPLDLLIASGGFHSARHEEPYVPGSECVGVVIESDAWPIGSTVYAECSASPSTPGSFATHVVADDGNILPLADGLDPAQAAAVGNSGVAAFMPLVESAAMKAGDTVMVLGATGAVGQLAVQIAKARGAGRVIGVGRDRAMLSKLAADAIVELRPDEAANDLAARLREVSGAVDVVLDGLYGMPLEAALQVCAPRARVVNVGHSAAPTAIIPAGLLRGKQLTMIGFAGLHTPLKDKQPALDWVWSALGEGTLTVNVKRVPLEEFPAAWRGQSLSPHAKYVVVPSQPCAGEEDK
jgi:NADPH2:quinone reductase